MTKSDLEVIYQDQTITRYQSALCPVEFRDLEMPKAKDEANGETRRLSCCMTPLELIAEWRKGCSNAPADQPELCPECTRRLIDALEARLGGWQQSCNFGGPPPEARG